MVWFVSGHAHVLLFQTYISVYRIAPFNNIALPNC